MVKITKQPFKSILNAVRPKKQIDLYRKWRTDQKAPLSPKTKLG